MTTTTTTEHDTDTHASGDGHGHGSKKADYDDVNVPAVILVGLISAVATLITILFFQGLCYHWQNSYLKRRSTEVVNPPARAAIEKQKEVLAGGAGTISINDAMNKVIEQYGSDGNKESE